jgi:hypothetical protein
MPVVRFARDRLSTGFSPPKTTLSAASSRSIRRAAPERLALAGLLEDRLVERRQGKAVRLQGPVAPADPAVDPGWNRANDAVSAEVGERDLTVTLVFQ